MHTFYHLKQFNALFRNEMYPNKEHLSSHLLQWNKIYKINVTSSNCIKPYLGFRWWWIIIKIDLFLYGTAKRATEKHSLRLRCHLNDFIWLIKETDTIKIQANIMLCQWVPPLGGSFGLLRSTSFISYIACRN